MMHQNLLMDGLLLWDLQYIIYCVLGMQTETGGNSLMKYNVGKIKQQYIYTEYMYKYMRMLLKMQDQVKFHELLTLVIHELIPRKDTEDW